MDLSRALGRLGRRAAALLRPLPVRAIAPILTVARVRLDRRAITGMVRFAKCLLTF